MRMTASLLGPVARQNTLPSSGSIHARSKCTPSPDSIARSRSWASRSCSAVTPTNPEWTSMNFAIGEPPSLGAAAVRAASTGDAGRCVRVLHRVDDRWTLPNAPYASRSGAPTQQRSGRAGQPPLRLVERGRDPLRVRPAGDVSPLERPFDAGGLAQRRAQPRIACELLRPRILARRERFRERLVREVLQPADARALRDADQRTDDVVRRPERHPLRDERIGDGGRGRIALV